MNGFELAKAALHAPALSASERLIFALVCDSCDEKGVAYLCKQEEIALAASLSERTVRSALAELEARGWLRRSRRHRQTGDRGVDIITVTPTLSKTKKPAFKIDLALALERAKSAETVVEPRQRMMPLPAVVGGQDRGDYRQPLPLGLPATIAASEADHRQPLPVGLPATIAAHNKTSSIEDSYKRERTGRSPLESGDPPAPERTAQQMAAELGEIAAALRAKEPARRRRA